MSNVIWTSIDEVPLDEWDGNDVEDIGVAPKTPSPGTIEYAVTHGIAVTSAKLLGTYVPFIREVKLGTIGKDVFAVKRALSEAGYGKWGEWGTRVSWFGPNRVKLLKQFQKDHKLKVDGVYGLETHKALAKYYDARGIWLLHHTYIVSSADQKRDLIVAAAMIGYQNRYSIHYTQSSMRMQGVRQHIHPPQYPIYEDCSSFATWCYYAANALDPNSLGYNGQGYTGTEWDHGIHVILATGKKGDLVFYGWRDGIPTHVAIYIGNGRVISHGSEIGPLLLSATYRSITGVRSYL